MSFAIKIFYNVIIFYKKQNVAFTYIMDFLHFYIISLFDVIIKNILFTLVIGAGSYLRFHIIAWRIGLIPRLKWLGLGLTH